MSFPDLCRDGGGLLWEVCLPACFGFDFVPQSLIGLSTESILKRGEDDVAQVGLLARRTDWEQARHYAVEHGSLLCFGAIASSVFTSKDDIPDDYFDFKIIGDEDRPTSPT